MAKGGQRLQTVKYPIVMAIHGEPLPGGHETLVFVYEKPDKRLGSVTLGLVSFGPDARINLLQKMQLVSDEEPETVEYAEPGILADLGEVDSFDFGLFQHVNLHRGHWI